MKQQVTIITDQNKTQLVVMLGEDVKFNEPLNKLNNIYYIEHLLRSLGFKVEKKILEVEVDEGN